MDRDELGRLIAHLRDIGNDTQECEVKEAAKKVPASLVETLSAFSNGDGGTVILGISEHDGFTAVHGFDARAMQEAFNAECEKLTPRVRPVIEILPFEGSHVLVAHIPPMAPRDRPCYVTTRGRYQGSYIRSGDGDRRLTPYEIDRMIENQSQPTFDDEVVEQATLHDLDASLVSAFIARQRELHPRVFGERSDEEILLGMHVIKHSDGGDADSHPTLGGLMALGTFPQQFFPRLNVTFTAFPGVGKGEVVEGGRRFLDAQTIVGPIPSMIEDALAAVTRNMRVGAVIDGAFRKDVPDYPRKAVREALSNALMHRDYSYEARGSQVQVNMYADRLEILNPGGLYGNVTVDTLGTVGMSSSRNQFLSNILETTPYPGGGYVVENRGTGYMVIEEELQSALMGPPRPMSTLTFFSLTFDKRRRSASEKDQRNWSRELVDDALCQVLRERNSASAKELAESSGLSRSAIGNHLRILIERGVVEPTEPPRSPRQRYRLVENAK
ncbi:ATP-binding protein [Bifidobacterium thermophilum]|uniref:ATP-binding protein n=1 Tax=Bifidobacterium thermophilum TaxID=33905 RepID=UPI003992561B